MKGSVLKNFCFLVFLGFISFCELGRAVPETSCEEVSKEGKNLRLIDVRTPEEFYSKDGHIEGAELVTIGPELTAFLKKTNPQEKIVFICRSGARSAKATAESMNLGFNSTSSMTGGMLRWKQLGYPTTSVKKP